MTFPIRGSADRGVHLHLISLAHNACSVCRTSQNRGYAHGNVPTVLFLLEGPHV
jgi:hypothetical protein